MAPRKVPTKQSAGDINLSPGSANLAIASTEPTSISHTPHQRRAISAIEQLRSEAPNVVHSILGTFLLHYFTCEVLAKLLQGARRGLSPSDSLDQGRSVDLRGLKPALSHFGIQVPSKSLDRIFQSQRTAVKRKSARLLRNAVVHEMNELDIAEINRRGSGLVRDMKNFINKIERATRASLKF